MADIHLITSSMHRPPQRRPDDHRADVVSLVERRQVEIVRRAARRRPQPNPPMIPDPPMTEAGIVRRALGLTDPEPPRAA
ncbi:hypothetical protein RHODGE_RHODGE_03286 [Rhodoplanes serenus]|uniref:Uncharacterized protein n=1 Tax=Rhodoplanes serenus TaxID=200615 RepID=A0A3S4BXQ3_9BRAD|nr:hypothetical protein [Rhodoplanes serenus]VCU10100.1 hypothetical protein RHODGE_RHODGE_03286 [Rhodoplanes serenus]